MSEQIQNSRVGHWGRLQAWHYLWLDIRKRLYWTVILNSLDNWTVILNSEKYNTHLFSGYYNLPKFISPFRMLLTRILYIFFLFSVPRLCSADRQVMNKLFWRPILPGLEMIYLCYEIQEKRNLAGGSICLWENCDDFPGQNQGSVPGVPVHLRSGSGKCGNNDSSVLLQRLRCWGWATL